MTEDEKELISRRTAAAYLAQLCPHCGAPMLGSTPAGSVPLADIPEPLVGRVRHEPPEQDEPEPSGWRDRPPLF